MISLHIDLSNTHTQWIYLIPAYLFLETELVKVKLRAVEAEPNEAASDNICHKLWTYSWQRHTIPV